MTSRLLPLLALFAAGGIFFGYVSPTWSNAIAQTKASIAADDHALETAAQYQAHQNALAAARNSIDPNDLSRLSNFLPDAVDDVGVILELNALAARSGISLTKVDVAPSAVASSGAAGSLDPVGSVDLSISATGPYAAFKRFISSTELSERLLDAERVVIQGSDTGVYNYDLTIRLYWLR